MSRHWIKRAIRHIGGLHKSLGVPQGQKIPMDRIRKAAHSKGLLGQQARLAMTLEGMPHPDEAAEAPPAPAPSPAPAPAPATATAHGGGLNIASRRG